MRAAVLSLALGYAHLPRLSGGRRQQAAVALNKAATGRSDLLALYASVVIRSHENDAEQALRLRAAQLCVEAGADTRQLECWARSAPPAAAPEGMPAGARDV